MLKYYHSRVTRIHYIQRNQSPSHKHRRVCHSKVSHNRNRHKMRFCIAAEFFAAFFATMYISSEVFASDLYCFSCFGYDKDGHTKCHSRDSGELFVRKCKTNSSEAHPACIEFTASFHIPQSIRGSRKSVYTEIHGVHCGTRQGCERKECPNFWRNDFVMEDCKISCCERKDGEKCSFPVPNKEEIASYNEEKGLRGGNDGNVKVGARGSGMARIFLSTWLQAVCFAIFGWLKL